MHVSKQAPGRPGEGRWSGLAKRYSICFGFSSSDPDRRHACGPSELAVACKRAAEQQKQAIFSNPARPVCVLRPCVVARVRAGRPAAHAPCSHLAASAARPIAVAAPYVLPCPCASRGRAVGVGVAALALGVGRGAGEGTFLLALVVRWARDRKTVAKGY
jgi:hypothetical protein